MSNSHPLQNPTLTGSKTLIRNLKPLEETQGQHLNGLAQVRIAQEASGPSENHSRSHRWHLMKLKSFCTEEGKSSEITAKRMRENLC